MNPMERKKLEFLEMLEKTKDWIVPDYFFSYNVRDHARTTSSQFRKRAAENAITHGDKPTLLYGNMQLYEKSELTSDLYFFINLFLDGGNNVPKILAEAGTSAAEIIIRKCSAYGIAYRTASKNLGNEDLTLSRIVRAFPLETAMEILRKKCRGILTSKFFKHKLPIVMQHTIFPGLIPATKFTKDLKEIAVILNMEISLILASPEEKLKMKNKPVFHLVGSSERFVDGAVHVENETEKLEILAKAGVLNATNNGQFELSATTIELKNELPAIRAVYSLTYSDAIRRLNPHSFF